MLLLRLQLIKKRKLFLCQIYSVFESIDWIPRFKLQKGFSRTKTASGMVAWRFKWNRDISQEPRLLWQFLQVLDCASHWEIYFCLFRLLSFGPESSFKNSPTPNPHLPGPPQNKYYAYQVHRRVSRNFHWSSQVIFVVKRATCASPESLGKLSHELWKRKKESGKKV